ncbi:MAG TPA: tetratricopeptide repeat protein, partial [Anaerolineales bacterium]|nr:tetratricopeptide repeat protein [Anaerolineales bacterium]
VIVEEQDGKSRYRFLETIRQYAMEKLVESGEAVETRDRHLDFMLGVVQYSPTRMFGTESLELLDEIDSEHDNLRAALEWATSNHLAKALKLAFSAGGFWTIRDYNAEAQFWCSTILQKTEAMPDLEADRARLYSLLGWLFMTLGEHKKGRAASEQAIALGEKQNDFYTRSRAYAIVGLASCFLGDFSTAVPAAEKAEQIAREHDLTAELSFILSSRAQLEFIGAGDLPKARNSVLEASELVRKAGFIWASTFMDIGMGHIAAVMGDLETARAAFGRSADTAKQLGNKRGALSSQSDFAHVLRQHGELDEALTIYKEVLPKWKDLGHRAAVAHVLECIGFVLIRKEEPERAINLLGAANALREAIDSEMTQIEREEHAKEVSALRELLGEAAFNKEWEKGRKMTMDEAIELAVKN